MKRAVVPGKTWRRPAGRAQRLAHVNPLALVSGKVGFAGVDPLELAALPEVDQFAVLSAMSSAERKGLIRSVSTLAGLGEFDDSELGALASATTAAAAELVECQKKHTAVKNQLLKRTNELKAAQEQIAKLTSDLTNARSAGGGIPEQQFTAVKNQLLKRTNELKDAQATIEQLRNAPAAAGGGGIPEQQFTAVKNQLLKRTNEVKDAQAQLATATAKAQADAAAIAELRTMLEKSGADLRDVTAKHAAVKQQLLKRTNEVKAAQSAIANTVAIGTPAPVPATAPVQAMSLTPAFDPSIYAPASPIYPTYAPPPPVFPTYAPPPMYPIYPEFPSGFAAPLDTGPSHGGGYGRDSFAPAGGHSYDDYGYLDYNGGDYAAASDDWYEWGYIDEGIYGLGCADCAGPRPYDEAEDEIRFDDDPQLGSKLSSLFKKVTGTKLSDVVGNAASAIPVVGPIVAGVLTGGGGGSSATAGAAGGPLSTPGVSPSSSREIELERQNAAQKQQIIHRTNQLKAAEAQLAESRGKGGISLSNPVVLACGALVLMTMLVGLRGGR
ncbi:MAG: hypothetical protein KF768_13500 [Phycisphaeraceae bacterium]|nr:hypothetical protein [Phycisphaeraceae bacterium]